MAVGRAETPARERDWSKVAPFLLGVVAFLLALHFFGPTDNWLWDPSFYYAQLRSPIIDGNFDWSDETIPANGVTLRTARGLQPSVWPVGPSVLWAPFFVAAHLYARLANPSGPTDGFGASYIAAVAGGSALYGLVGLLVLYRLCRLFAPRNLSALTAVLVLVASPLFFYVFRQPIMAHSTSFLASAALLLACVMAAQGRLELGRSGLILGTLTGLNAVTRWASVLIAIVPLTLFGWQLLTLARAGERTEARRLMVQLLGFAVGFGLVLLPQFALWYQTHGSWLVFPSQGFTTGLLPRNLLNLFFHTNRGLLYWAPFVLMGLGGLARVRPAPLRLALLLYVGAYLYVLGRWGDWYSGGGFGARYFIETLPVAAIGFVTLMRGAWTNRAARVLITGLAAALMLHGLTLLHTYEQNKFPADVYGHGAPLGFAYQLENFGYLLRHPGELVGPRLAVSEERQTVVYHLLRGSSQRGLYEIPLAGAVVLSVGLASAAYAGRFLTVQRATALLIVYMVGYSLFFLSI
jgi:hypothetical protein